MDVNEIILEPKEYQSHLLEDKIELVSVLKEFTELDYIRVSLAVVESLHLAEHPGAGVTWHLVDDLHCKLLARVDVHARLYRGVSTLTEHFARQFVQV